MNSLILDIIKDNTDWEQILTKKKIKIKSTNAIGFENLRLFIYDIGVDFNDPVVQEARGIIIDIERKMVVSRRFDKFFNWSEPQHAEIDWATAHTQEKIDGSLVALWYYNGQWIWSTNGTILAEEANVGDTNSTFMDVIRSANNFKDINYNSLNKNHTYIFELVSPLTKIVINYPYTHLYSIGERDVYGNEYKPNIGIEKPKEYELHSFVDAILAVGALNLKGQDIQHEGFVVVDKNYNRIKIKTDEYFEMHRANGMTTLSKKKVVGMFLDKETAESIHSLGLTAPAQVRSVIAWYEYQIAKIELEVESYIYYVRHFYEENNFNRKAVSEKIKNDKYAVLGFKALDNNSTAKELISRLPLNKYLTYIENYKN